VFGDSQWAGCFILSLALDYSAVPNGESSSSLPIQPTSPDLGKSVQTPLYLTKDTPRKSKMLELMNILKKHLQLSIKQRTFLKIALFQKRALLN